MANRYTIGSGLASNPAIWDGGVSTPVAGDRVLISATHTVELDNTYNGGAITWGDDTNNTIVINGVSTTTSIWVAGTLKFSRSSGFTLTCRGTLTVAATGTVDIGQTTGVGSGPIPAGVVHRLKLNDSAALAANKYGMDCRVNGAQFYAHGAVKVINAYLTSEVSIGASSVLVDDATGWASGDRIILGPTGAWNSIDERTISGAPVNNGNGTWTVTLSSATTYGHLVGGPVGNFTHNVVFTSSNTAYHGWFTQEWGNNQAAGTRDIRYSLFEALGNTGGGNERKWGALSVYGTSSATMAAGSPIYCKCISIYNTLTSAHGLNLFLLRHRAVFEDFAIHVSAGMVTIFEAFGSIADLNRFVTYKCNNAINSGYGQGGANIRHTDCMFLGCNGYLINLQAAMSPQFVRCVFDASASLFLYVASMSAKFTDCKFGTKFAGFSDLSVGGFWQANAEGSIGSAVLTDCTFQPGIPLVNTAWAGAKVQDTSAGTEFRFANLNGDPLKQTIYTPGGVVERGQTIVPAGYDSSIKASPFNANVPLTSEMQVMAPNATPVVVTGLVYIDAAYNGPAPTAALSGLGVSQSVSLDLGVRDAWQQFVVVGTQSSGADGVLTLTMSCSGTAGSVLWSGLSNPPSVAITTGGFRWWTGGAPVGALLANFVAAADVWGVQAASAQAAGSIGELTGEIWRRLGLDPAAPLATSQTQITAGAGITIDLAEDGQTVTATRQ